VAGALITVCAVAWDNTTISSAGILLFDVLAFGKAFPPRLASDSLIRSPFLGALCFRLTFSLRVYHPLDRRVVPRAKENGLIRW